MITPYLIIDTTKYVGQQTSFTYHLYSKNVDELKSWCLEGKWLKIRFFFLAT